MRASSRGGFKKWVKHLLKCSSCFQVVMEGAFGGSLSNVMVGNFPNYLDTSSLVPIPLCSGICGYLASVSMDLAVFIAKLNYFLTIFRNRERWVVVTYFF